MNFVQEAMGDADAILFVTDLFETEFANTQVQQCSSAMSSTSLFPQRPSRGFQKKGRIVGFICECFR